jgi:hypothetical protein
MGLSGARKTTFFRERLAATHAHVSRDELYVVRTLPEQRFEVEPVPLDEEAGSAPAKG